MQSEKRKEVSRIGLFTRQAFLAAAIISLFIIIFYLIESISYVLVLLFGSVLMAILLSGLAKYVTKLTHLPRRLSLAVVVIAGFASLTGIGWLIGPQISDQIVQLQELIPRAIRSIINDLKTYEWFNTFLADSMKPEQVVSGASGVLSQVTGIFSTFVEFLVYMTILFFLAVYLALKPEFYLEGTLKLIPSRNRERAKEIVKALNHALRWWLAGRFASMIVIGIMVGLGFWAIGLPLPLALGVITALFSFIPFLGPFFSYVPALMIAVIEGPSMMLWVTIVYIGVQLLESYVITPYIEHRAVSLPPALLIIMQILMAMLTGIVGVLLATPILVVVIVLIQTLYIQGVLEEEVTLLGDKPL